MTGVIRDSVERPSAFGEMLYVVGSDVDKEGRRLFTKYWLTMNIGDPENCVKHGAGYVESQVFRSDMHQHMRVSVASGWMVRLIDRGDY